MENGERPENPKSQIGLTWPAVIGIALVTAGFSESLHYVRRIANGENALFSSVCCLALAFAGGWIVRREKRRRRNAE